MTTLQKLGLTLFLCRHEPSNDHYHFVCDHGLRGYFLHRLAGIVGPAIKAQGK
jgi:hypothetical protein